MKINKNNIIINYVSNYKFSLNNIFYYNINLLKKNTKKIVFFHLPQKKKNFTLLKSPKCHKVGKLNIVYSFYNLFLKINIFSYKLTLNNLLSYFFFVVQKYKIYQTSLIKIKRIKLIICIFYTIII